MRRTTSRSVLAVVLAVALTGCGARLTDEQRTSALGGTQATGAARAEAGTSPVEGAQAATTVPADGAAPVDAAPAAVDPAAAGTPGQPQPAAAGGACTPQGSGEGFTATEITIGNVSTISGPVPGLGQTAQNGLKAYVNYINSKGGVCGRKLKVVTTDDRLDSGTNRAETQRLMGQVLAFAGSFSVVDDGGASVLAGTNIADVSLALSQARIEMPNNFSPSPIDPADQVRGTLNIQRYFKQTAGVTKAAVVYAAQANAKKGGEGFKKDLEAAGIEVVLMAETATTQTDYTGVATQIKNAGAELVITAVDIGGAARLAQAIKQQNVPLKVPFYGSQAYGRKFLQLAGAGAEGAVAGVTYAIPEDTTNPAMQTFSQWYARSNPGADPDYFAILGWAAATILVTAIEQAGPTPTRDAVLAKLRATTSTDAGGVIAPQTNPAGKKPSPCFAIIGVEGGRWVKKHPAQGFQC
jgi:ABC-type branched-subunit amino acid transport system substrate-binding protein